MKTYILAVTETKDGVRLTALVPEAKQDLVVIVNDGEGEQTMIHAHYAHPEQLPPHEEVIGYIVRGWADLERP